MQAKQNDVHFLSLVKLPILLCYLFLAHRYEYYTGIFIKKEHKVPYLTDVDERCRAEVLYKTCLLQRRTLVFRLLGYMKKAYLIRGVKRVKQCCFQTSKILSS